MHKYVQLTVVDLGFTEDSAKIVLRYSAKCSCVLLPLVSDDEHSSITSDTASAWMITLMVSHGQTISASAYQLKIMNTYLNGNALSNIDTYELTATVEAVTEI